MFLVLVNFNSIKVQLKRNDEAHGLLDEGHISIP